MAKTDLSQFKGVFTALITPFDKQGQVDEAAFETFVDWQVREGVSGVVPCGTTGESPTLSYAEHKRVIEQCIDVVGGRVPVMAGTGSNSTEEAIMLTQHAKQAGAEAALVVVPYYNKPSQEGMYQHFKAIAETVDLPLFIYNIPGRSVVNLADETIARLAKLENIAGIKDATGDLTRPLLLRELAPDFIQLSGEDMTAVAFNASGGVGCISVTSNIFPKEVAKVQELSLQGKFAEALALHQKLVPVHQAMFCETSPAPVKYAASVLGKCLPSLRLPLVEASASCRNQVENVLNAMAVA